MKTKKKKQNPQKPPKKPNKPLPPKQINVIKFLYYENETTLEKKKVKCMYFLVSS